MASQLNFVEFMNRSPLKGLDLDIQRNPATCILRTLGLQPYSAVWDSMRAFTQNRGPDAADELWVVEHLPVYTQGQAGRAEHVIDPQDMPIVQSDRGGQITYHGPGQVIVYVLVDLKRQGLDLKSLRYALEASVIDLLADYQILASRRIDAPGIYVGDAKIAFIGLRIRRGCSYHGISLNIDMDLSPFSRIDPCGYPNLKVIQLGDLVPGLSKEDVVERWVGYLQRALGYTQLQQIASL